MLIHITPKLYVPFRVQPGAIQLVDLVIDELSVTLRGGIDITVRRPYPNKCFWVGCRKVGQRAVSGIFLESSAFVPTYTVVCRWTMNDGSLFTHRIKHNVLNQEFDAVSDDMTLWSRMKHKGLNWSSRWPECYAHLAPVHAEPRMDVVCAALGGTTSKISSKDVLTSAGELVSRDDTFALHTIERSRLTDNTFAARTLPEMHHAFSIAPEHQTAATNGAEGFPLKLEPSEG